MLAIFMSKQPMPIGCGSLCRGEFIGIAADCEV